MTYLIIVSVIWAFSFGLIKKYLTGLDPMTVAFFRLLLSFLLFLPFLRPKKIDRKRAGQFFLLGFIQFGLMYVTYISAFRFLSSAQVALLTVATPVFVSLLQDLLDHSFSGRNMTAALLAMIGCGIIVFSSGGISAHWRGFLLIQASNACFAFGQVYFRKIMKNRSTMNETNGFAFSYLGGLTVSGAGAMATGNLRFISLNSEQLIVILYLGVIASGLGFFFWNRGALKVSIGTLAVLNNLKIPLAVAASLIVFGEKTDWLRLLAGAALLFLALFLPRRRPAKTATIFQ